MKTLMNVKEASDLIQSGNSLMIAGDENLLKQLPQGNWIGGSIPYFMSEKGGVTTSDKLQVVELPAIVRDAKIKFYGENELSTIPKDYHSNGVSFILIPGMSAVHQKYAEESMTYDGIFDRPLVGWITGVHLDDIGKVTPKVMNGMTGEFSENKAVVMHLNLPERKFGHLNIINIFKQGTGDTLTFPKTGFQADTCFVNGKETNFAEYLAKNNIDTKLPLVANYNGAMINVSFQSVDNENKKVKFYAPVFVGVEYKMPVPIEDYEEEFDAEIRKHNISPVFTCICILNFNYANLEGKKAGEVVGPITFGEIAYILLNQTMVYLTIEEKS